VPEPARRPHRYALAPARRVPRPLHPLAWWAWALGLATAVSRTANPLLLLLVLGVLGVTVARCRGDAPWARAFKYYLALAGIVLVVRVVFRAVFGGDVETVGMHVLFRLPSVPLPHWAAGVQLGGPVTLEGTLSAAYDGLRLGCLLACLGAANTLANPKRALRLLPGALYELGAAVVVSFSVAPQLIESVQRVRRARRLRGDTHAGRHALRRVVVPVLEDALERSLHLAAAMDARGYGRTGDVPRAARRLNGALVVAGMSGLCLWAVALLDGSVGGPVPAALLAGGAALSCLGLVTGGRRVHRSRYRPDVWRLPEWLVALSGAVPAVVLVTGVGFAAGAVAPSVQPLQWPTLPLVPVLVILFAALPLLAAPPVPQALASGQPPFSTEDASRVPAAAPLAEVVAS
jgi:energy-coupling factor transport system permease protein